jgi:NAD(P)-dependent dehydrogenase (short-subunit alcohol dehydrogenase family)
MPDNMQGTVLRPLENKVAIVTGASRGLGRDIALGLAGYGAAVVAAARSEEEKGGLPGTIQATARQIEAKGGRCLPVQTDVTNEDSVGRMVDKALEAFGTIDILVNNAGIAFYLPAAEMPLRRWDLVIRVNLYGTFICSKAVLPHMIGQGSGSIINMSSYGRKTIDPARLAGEPLRGITAYEAAKGGIEHFTTSLAAEVGAHNVAVNCLKPEFGIATEGMKFLFPAKDWSGWASSDSMVKAVVFLARQSAAGVNGLVAGAEELAELHAGTFPWKAGLST